MKRIEEYITEKFKISKDTKVEDIDIDWEEAQRGYIEIPPIKSDYNSSGELKDILITSIKIYQNYKGNWEVRGNNYGRIIFPGRRPGSNKEFKTLDALKKAIEIKLMEDTKN